MAVPSHHQHHGHGQAGGADEEAHVARTELEGELFLSFVTDSAGWIARLRGPDAPPVQRVLDIGSGPGVGTCELARLFPDAHVTAVDSSPAMLARARRRAAARDLEQRIGTHLATLPAGVDGLEPVDVIWASMSLHHVADEAEAVRVLSELLEPSGLLAIAEVAEPTRILPDLLDVGRPGLADRLVAAEKTWFATMRSELAGGAPPTDLTATLTSAGLEIVGSRLARERLDPPLSEAARTFVQGRLVGARQQLGELLDDDDRHALEVLGAADDPRGVLHRDDLSVAVSRQIVVARPRRTTRRRASRTRGTAATTSTTRSRER